MRRRTRLDQSTLLALVDAAYSAAEEHHRWEPLLASIADAVAGTAACLLVHNLVEAGNAFMAAGFDEIVNEKARGGASNRVGDGREQRLPAMMLLSRRVGGVDEREQRQIGRASCRERV